LTLSGTGVDLRSLTAGTIANTTIKSAGSLGTIAAGQMTGDKIYAGIGSLSAGRTLPTAASDFVAPAAIAAIRVKKGKATATFSNTAIAATSIGSASLGSVALANGGTTFGLAARAIRTVSGADSATGKAFHLSKLAGVTDTAALLNQQGITPQDFVVRLI
jgi:hypothetical protein